MTVSIMIATKDRPEFIKRSLEYYSKSNFDGEILIGDSSSNTNSEKLLKIIDQYKKKIKIIYYKNIQLSADQMMSYLTAKVNFDYSVMINDDDVLVISSIKKCIKFLQDHHDYTAVNGRAYNMGVDFNSYKPFGNVTYIKKYNLLASESNEPFERIKQYFDNPLNINMSITRSKINNLAFNNLMKINKFDSSFVFGELIHGSTILANGKIASLNECYLVRQKHPDQYYRRIQFNDWLKKTDLAKSVLELNRVIEDELLKNSTILNDDLKGKINLLLSSKVNYILSRMMRKSNIHLQSIKQIYNKLANIFDYLKIILGSFNKKSKIKFETIYENDKELLKLYFNVINKK